MFRNILKESATSGNVFNTGQKEYEHRLEEGGLNSDSVSETRSLKQTRRSDRLAVILDFILGLVTVIFFFKLKVT